MDVLKRIGCSLDGQLRSRQLWFNQLYFATFRAPPAGR